MSSSSADYYQTHLDRVSRSFALCIRQLPSPLRDWVGLSYLLCRLVDTIEDSHWPNLSEQLLIFARFDRALLAEAEVVHLRDWQRAFPAGLPEGEIALLVDAEKLLTDYHRFPPQIHEVIRELVHSMSRGMQHFCRRKNGGHLRLGSLTEVNQYCFFVAGLVGELLVKLSARIEPRFPVTESMLVKAHHFGQFLQKVNLLKDQVGDEREGRYLIPSREQVELSSRENANRAFEFLLALPKEQIEFRRFCAWSLFLGLEALRVARRSLVEHKVLKVSRQRTMELFASIEGCLSDDGRMRQLFQSLTEVLGWTQDMPRVTRGQVVPEWMRELYHGPLEPISLSQLGVTSP